MVNYWRAIMRTNVETKSTAGSSSRHHRHIHTPHRNLMHSILRNIADNSHIIIFILVIIHIRLPIHTNRGVIRFRLLRYYAVQHRFLYSPFLNQDTIRIFASENWGFLVVVCLAAVFGSMSVALLIE
jgi:hypothetical protein